MSEYRLDRSTFEAFKAEDKIGDYSFWNNRSLLERLEAAHYLIRAAYQISGNEFPTFDRESFQMIKRNK